MEIRKKCVFSKEDIEECEHATEMIRELSCGINGFSMTEITDILAYISTNEPFLILNYCKSMYTAFRYIIFLCVYE